MTENTTRVYWAGPPFEVVHHARKVKVANGENDLPVSLAKRLKPRLALNGMVGLPEPTTNADGTIAQPSAELVASVKAAADKRHASAHRHAGQVPTKFDATGKPAGPAAPKIRDRPGSRLEPAPQVDPAPEAETEPPPPGDEGETTGLTAKEKLTAPPPALKPRAPRTPKPKAGK